MSSRSSRASTPLIRPGIGGLPSRELRAEKDLNTQYCGSDWLASTPTITRVDTRAHSVDKDGKGYPARHQVGNHLLDRSRL